MKQILILLVCLTSLVSCSNNNNDEVEKPVCACGFSNVLEDVEWLKEVKESLTDCDQYTTKSIYKATYQEQTVIYVYITNNNPLANTLFSVTLLDCKGEIVEIFEYNEKEEFYELVTNAEVLYSCKQ